VPIEHGGGLLKIEFDSGWADLRLFRHNLAGAVPFENKPGMISANARAFSEPADAAFRLEFVYFAGDRKPKRLPGKSNLGFKQIRASDAYISGVCIPAGPIFRVDQILPNHPGGSIYPDLVMDEGVGGRRIEILRPMYLIARVAEIFHRPNPAVRRFAISKRNQTTSRTRCQRISLPVSRGDFDCCMTIVAGKA
jgi:hypothetical protein